MTGEEGKLLGSAYRDRMGDGEYDSRCIDVIDDEQLMEIKLFLQHP